MSDKTKKVHHVNVELQASEYTERLKYIYEFVNELNKELHPDTYKTEQRYKLAKAYDPAKVEQVIDTALSDPKQSKQWRFTDSHLRVFKNNLPELLQFFSKFKNNGELVIEQYSVVPNDPKYSIYFDEKPTTKLIKREPRPALNKLLGDKLKTIKPISDEQIEFTEYAIKDLDGLVGAIKRDERTKLILYKLELPQDVKLIKKTVETAIKDNNPDLLKDLPTPERYTERLAETLKLSPFGNSQVWTSFDTHLLLGELGGLVALTGVTDTTKGGSLYTNIPDKTLDGVPLPVTDSYQVTLDEITNDPETVGLLVKERRSKAELVGEGVGREVVNIKDADQHRYIGRPSTMGLMDMITKAVEGKDLNDLKERYLDQESRNADGGFLLHIDNPQTALPLAFDKDDITPRQQAKMVANSVALTVQSLGALQAYRRDNPDSDGYIKLKDLAKYVKRYADDMAIKGSLRPQYRQQLLNGLTLATLAGTSYIISRDKKTGKARHGVVYLIDRISEYETNKKGDIIAVKTDFTQEYKASLQYNLGVLTDGVQNLDRTEPINLATYILDRQVAKQNDTIAGKPIKCRADKLCKVAGITDQTVTNRYNTLAKILNELQAEGVAVGRWTTEAKGNTITGYNPDSQKLYIYPTKAVQTTYTTKERTKAVREAYKTEQKARLKALKKYAKGYTDLDVLAKEMDISRHQLDELLAGQQPITVHLMGLIDTEIANT